MTTLYEKYGSLNPEMQKVITEVAVESFEQGKKEGKLEDQKLIEVKEEIPEDAIKIEDEGGDRNYFTIIPNYILNHSTDTDQALYLQLRRYAGEKGIAYPSNKTLAKKLGIDTRKLKKSIQYLINHKWIKDMGKIKIQTDGGPQSVNSYKIVDIWKLNSDFYQGGIKTDTPSKGLSKCDTFDQRGCQNVSKGVAIQQTNKNYNTNKIKQGESSLEDSGNPPNTAIPPKFPDNELVQFYYDEVKRLKGIEAERNTAHYRSAYNQLKKRSLKENKDLITWYLSDKESDTIGFDFDYPFKLRIINKYKQQVEYDPYAKFH